MTEKIKITKENLINFCDLMYNKNDVFLRDYIYYHAIKLDTYEYDFIKKEGDDYWVTLNEDEKFKLSRNRDGCIVIPLSGLKQAMQLTLYSGRDASEIYLNKDCFNKDPHDFLGYHNNGPWVQIKDNIRFYKSDCIITNTQILLYSKLAFAFHQAGINYSDFEKVMKYMPKISEDAIKLLVLKKAYDLVEAKINVRVLVPAGSSLDVYGQTKGTTGAQYIFLKGSSQSTNYIQIEYMCDSDKWNILDLDTDVTSLIKQND
jgi:hypothetical protein